MGPDSGKDLGQRPQACDLVPLWLRQENDVVFKVSLSRPEVRD